MDSNNLIRKAYIELSEAIQAGSGVEAARLHFVARLADSLVALPAEDLLRVGIVLRGGGSDAVVR